MKRAISLTVLGHFVAVVTASYTPKLYSVGANTTIDAVSIQYTGQELTLDASSPVVTFDYAHEVGGFPFIVVESPDEPCQIELKYSEPFDGLSMAYGDGTWLYVDGLMNSFRMETFNITKAGKTESFFLQGGLRWQSITLLSGSGVRISQVGIRPSVQVKDPNTCLPGSFSTSKDIYQQVWDLGATAVQAACVDIGSQPSTWEVSDKGAFIRGQYPAVSALGTNFSYYTLEFSTKITAGGTGWRVAGGANGGYGMFFLLTSNGPQLQSENVPALAQNELITAFGYSIIQQAILPSSPVQSYNVSARVEDDTWYKITTTISDAGYNVSIDGKQIAFVNSTAFTSFANPAWGTGTTTNGTFGFGPYLNQAAWFKDVTVTAQNGSVIYNNPLTSNEVYKEYSIAANDRAVCLDGAKRDREIWIGDYAHTGRSIAVSTGRFDYLTSMIEFEFDWQYPPGPAEGLVPIQAYLGGGKKYREVFYPSEFGETDYQFFFMLVLGDYLAVTGDKALLKKHWAGTKQLVATLVDRYLDSTTNLMSNADASWFTAPGVQNATAPTALFVTGLNELINVAIVLGDKTTEKSWTALAASLTDSVNSQLWNDDLGTYSFALSQPNATAILATAFTIRAGMATPKRAAKSVEALANCFLNIGYKDISTTADSATTQMSPNTQGFLFETLFLAHMDYKVPVETVMPAIRNLSEVFFPKMANQPEYFTGCSWEYEYADGTPGIGIFTSLCHPWGGAATYIYTNYILGIRPNWNAKQGDYEWVFDPAWQIAEGLGLTWAKGKVPLFDGGYIQAEWSSGSNSTTGSGSGAGAGKPPTMTAKVVGNKNVKVKIMRKD